MPSHQNAPYSRSIFANNHIKNALDTAIDGKLARLGFPMLVKVIDVHTPDVALTGTVDVQPLLQQQDSLSRAYKRAPLYSIPYLRIQGGTSALIIDPQPGDIGFIIISGRDHSHVLQTRQESAPASFRKFTFQDAVYVGGFLNETPNQYIHFTADGLRVVTPGTITLNAAKITANCDISTSGEITAGHISLTQHTHNGVQPGGAKTSPPQ